MKNFNSFFFAASLIAITFTSCSKQLDVVPPAPVTGSTGAASLAEMTAAESFDWSTTKKVALVVEGHATEQYTLLLQVLDADGNVLMQKMQKSDETYRTTLKIAADQSTITVNYGAESNNIDCSTGTATITLN